MKAVSIDGLFEKRCKKCNEVLEINEVNADKAEATMNCLKCRLVYEFRRKRIMGLRSKWVMVKVYKSREKLV